MSIDAQFIVQRQDFLLDINLSLPVNGITILLGPSGCGKTTFLRAIAGLEHHKNGALKVDGVIWQNKEVFLPTHKRPLGYVFQEPSLFSHLNVRKNIEYGITRRGKDGNHSSLDTAIKLLDITHLLDRKPNDLSGGERQRVAIARALAVTPQLLLMDEPLSSLDIGRRQEVLPYITTLNKELKIPIIYVTHSHEEAAKIADHIILLDQGKVVGTGDVNEMLPQQVCAEK